ncbi:MAG: adenylate kinase, partial [Kiritimatiellae bacterium]|nr:adenylate kinase [Kiritimatiellia bacterium]
TLIRRDDDDPAKVAHRLQVYRRQTAALIEWYEKRGLLLRVDGCAPLDEIVTRIAGAVAA